MKNKKYLYIIAVLLVTIPIILFIISEITTPKTKTNITPTTFPTITPVASIYGFPTSSTPNSTSTIPVITSQPANMQSGIQLDTPINLTFNQSLSQQDLSISIDPKIDFTTTIQNNNLTITPNSQLSPNTVYTFIIRYSPNTPAFIYALRTIGGPPDSFDFPHQRADQEDIFYAPDTYLSNKTPYSTNNFSVTSDVSQTTGNFVFIVSLIGPDKNKDQQEFINWVKSQGLTDSQIQKLEITYQ